MWSPFSSRTPSPPLPTPKEYIASCLEEIKTESNFIQSQPSEPSITTTKKDPKSNKLRESTSTDTAASNILGKCMSLISVIREDGQNDPSLREEAFIQELKREAESHRDIALAHKKKRKRGMLVPQYESGDGFLELAKKIEKLNGSLGDDGSSGTYIVYTSTVPPWIKKKGD